MQMCRAAAADVGNGNTVKSRLSFHRFRAILRIYEAFSGSFPFHVQGERSWFVRISSSIGLYYVPPVNLIAPLPAADDAPGD